MSGFALLHWRPDADSVDTATKAERACLALRQTHPVASRQHVSEFSGDGFWSCKLDTVDSEHSAYVTHRLNGSWIFVLGSAAYNDKRVCDSILPDLLRDVVQNPCGTAKCLDGTFVVVAFDRPRKRAIVVPSALGQFAVYIRRGEDGVIGLSSSILPLCAMGPVTLDEFACRSLYRCGHRLPPNTVYREIQSVPEGCLLEIRCGQEVMQRYWSPSLAESTRYTFAETAEKISDRLVKFCTSVIRPDAPLVSDLTGGYDSRVATASLLKAEVPFLPTVTGSIKDPDVIVSSRICGKEKLPLQVVEIDGREDPSNDIRTALMLSEACLDTSAFLNTLRVKMKIFSLFEQSPVITISGALGECYREFYWTQEFFDLGQRKPPSIDRLIRYRMDCNPAAMDFFVKDWHRAWRAELAEYLNTAIEPYAGERNTSQLDAIYLRKMTGMAGGFSSALSRCSAPLMPLSSPKTLDLALCVPAHWRSNDRLLRQVCWSLHPRLANYQTVKGSPCAPVQFGNWYRFLPKYVMRMGRIVRKFKAVWFGRASRPDRSKKCRQDGVFDAFIAKELCGGGHLNWDSMRTADWYEPKAMARLVQDARIPTGQEQRRAILWIYTCEAMARLAASICQPLVVGHSMNAAARVGEV